MHDQFTLRLIDTNGITMRAAVEGDGPLVVLVHGWPELWYSWRHQIKPLANAGYRVVAPDVRGYGGSDKPQSVEAYDMVELMADVVGLIDAFGDDKAILVGHDWGAPIVWNTAALHPERVSAVAGMSVPYRKRGRASHLAFWRKVNLFYQLYFQDEGVAEAELERNVRTTLRKVYFAASGDAPSADGWFNGSAEGDLLGAFVDPDPFPAWITETDLAYFVANFEAGGFRGPLSRYRNQERDFQILPEMGVAPITQPSCFIGGSEDFVRRFVPNLDAYDDVSSLCTEFRGKTIVDGVGHWVQQEAPKEVTDTLLRFLASL